VSRSSVEWNYSPPLVNREGSMQQDAYSRLDLDADDIPYANVLSPVVDLPPIDQRQDYLYTCSGNRAIGVHLIIDLFGATRLNEVGHVEETLRSSVKAAGATLLHIYLHRFEPNGVSGVAVLAESHISIHTWPEVGYAAIDVFMCGAPNINLCISVLRDAFEAERVVVNEILRGQGV
jgi:S-adenosylmethionine decarboxylase